MDKAIWLTWENQIRNKSMSSLLGAKLYVITYNGNRLLRYVYCIFKTYVVLFKEKPHFVFAQNPSVFLICLLLLAKRWHRYKIICDAHYVGIVSCYKCSLYQKILDICNRLVDLVIVTNNEHHAYVQKIGGCSVICEDPLPDISQYYKEEVCHEKMVYYICSFDIDEPYEVAFKAAKLLFDDNFRFYVTGNYRRVNIDPSKYSHIKFLGYIPEDQYYNMLYQSNVVLDLTYNDNCLVCGAYESMVAEKPLVTSDTICLRKYFTKGTVFTNNDKERIANAVKLAYRDRHLLKKEIIQWKTDIKNRQSENITNILKKLGINIPLDFN